MTESNPNVWKMRIPGARWFRCDLHVHTIDDHPNPRVKWPLAGEVEFDRDKPNPAALKSYARAFLEGAIAAGVEVVGLTPHCPRAGSGAESSAVWHIIDEWRNGTADSGTPYSDQIFAVFPGFEPNLKQGREGLHLLVLFDWTIDRERFFSLFTAVMEGRDAWKDSCLQTSPKDAPQVFELLEDASNKESFQYLCLAPHADRNNGLFHTLKGNQLAEFPSERLAGYELPNGTTLAMYRSKDKNSAKVDFAEQHQQAFYHATDAYALGTAARAKEEVGQRYTWLKLASPTIEAVRQAFLAGESRLRTALESADGGVRMSECDLSEPQHRWLRRLKVDGKSCFFRGPADASVVSSHRPATRLG